MSMFTEQEREAAQNGAAPCDDCLDEKSLFEELNNRLASVQANQRALSIAVARVDYQTLIIVGMLALIAWKVRRGIA